jgi:Predicted transcriptional regulator
MTTSAPNAVILARILAEMGVTPERLEAARQAMADAPPATDSNFDDIEPPQPERKPYARRPRAVPAHVYQAARVAKPVPKNRLDEAVRWVRESGLISRPLACTLSSLIGFLPWKQSQAGDFLVFPSNATLADVLNLTPRSVQRHLDALEAAGLIIRVYRSSPQGYTRKGINLAPFAARIEEFFDMTLQKSKARKKAKKADDYLEGREPLAANPGMSSPHDNVGMDITSPNQNINHCTGNQGDVVANSRGRDISGAAGATASSHSPRNAPQPADQKALQYRQRQIARRIARIRLLQPSWPEFPPDLIEAAKADFGDVTLGLGLPKRVWTEAVNTHGELAVAAMVAMALVKKDIRVSRIAWLRGTLQKSRDALDAWSGVEAEIKRQRPGGHV